MSGEKTKIKITQVHSGAGRYPNQKKILEALGLKRLHHTVIHQNTPTIRGMVKKVLHLVTYEEIQ